MMRMLRTAVRLLALSIVTVRGATAQLNADTTRTDHLPINQGQLNLETATVRVNNGNLEVLLVPLDERVLRLLTPDAYRSMQRLIGQYRTQIDSVANDNGVTDPGLALVSFHGLAPNTRFDPSLITLIFHGQQFHPAGWVAMSPTFSNEQLNLREQVQALFIFRRDIPVREAFTFSYLTATNDDWERRLPRFDAERTRILGAVRSTPDSVKPQP